MDNTGKRIIPGGLFGFTNSIISGFAIILIPLYLASLDLSLLLYGLLLSVGDIASFLLKPLVGYVADRYGERKYLALFSLTWAFAFFSISLTSNIAIIAMLKISSSVSSSILLVIINIFALRAVVKEPDRKVSVYSGLTGAGWIAGLILPGLIVGFAGMGWAFAAAFAAGLSMAFLSLSFFRRYDMKIYRGSFSLGQLKKIPLPLAFKSLDIALFNAFVALFVMFGLKSLGLGRSAVVSIIVLETVVFTLSLFIIGRNSNSVRRRLWIPAGFTAEALGVMLFLAQPSMASFFSGAAFIGIGGAFIEIWVYSYISEKFRVGDKGKAIGMTGLCYDLGTIFGVQVSILLTLAGVPPFGSLLIFPLAGLGIFIAYYLLR